MARRFTTRVPSSTITNSNYWVVVLVTVMLGTNALAAPLVRSTDPPPTHTTTIVPLSWSDIIRIVDRHPRLVAGKFQVDAARGAVDAASAAPNPTLEGNVGRGMARLDGATHVEWGLSLTMPLGWIAQRGYRIDAAKADVEIALAEAAALRRDILLQLRTLFWNLVYEQARSASLEALSTQTLALVRTVKQRVEKGESRPVEATRVEIELEKVLGELDTARTALDVRNAELSLWLGGIAGKTLVANAALDELPVVLTRDIALSTARDSHPMLEVARAKTRSLEADIGVEKRARVPAFSLSGFTTHDLDRSAFGVGLAIELPVFNWNSGRIAQAEARLSASRKQAESTRLELESTVLETQAACQASVATATRFRDNVVPRSEITVSTIEKTYQVGEASLFEVIDARRTLLDARRFYLSTLVQAQIDCSHLSVLIGEKSQ